MDSTSFFRALRIDRRFAHSGKSLFMGYTEEFLKSLKEFFSKNENFFSLHTTVINMLYWAYSKEQAACQLKNSDRWNGTAHRA